MIEVTGLNRKMDHYDEDVKSKIISTGGSMPDMRSMAIQALGKGVGKSKEQSIEAFAVIGLLLKNKGDVINMENAEFKLMKELCEDSSAFTDRFFYAQLVMWVDENEKKQKPIK